MHLRRSAVLVLLAGALLLAPGPILAAPVPADLVLSPRAAALHGPAALPGRAREQPAAAQGGRPGAARRRQAAGARRRRLRNAAPLDRRGDTPTGRRRACAGAHQR